MNIKSLLTIGALSFAWISIAGAQTVIETFEYPTGDDLVAAWIGSAGAVVSASDDVSSQSEGTTAMKVEFSFPTTAYATETVRGPDLAEPIAIAPEQYVSFRVKGDPQFASADFRNLYLYAYDVNGYFGRWGAPVSLRDTWQVMNFVASTLEKPWDSTELPDLTQIVRFAFFQYGSEKAIPEYSAVIYLDDVTVRDTPLAEPPPIQESVVETFEYDEAALLAAWRPSPNAVVSASSAVAPASAGTNAMKVTFNFPSTTWATETVSGPELASPVGVDGSQYVSFRIKGDPAFASTDFRSLYLYAYDASGNFGRWGTPVPITSDWQIFNFKASTIEKPWDSPATPNLGQIVRFAFFQYGSETTHPAYSASIELDDLTIRNSPLVDATPEQEQVVEAFEYADEDTLLAAWRSSPRTTVSLTDDVSPRANGAKAMKLEFSFASSVWSTESASGPTLETPVAIGPSQYLVFRIKGDAAFTVSDFSKIYLYAYDSDGNFGRWGADVPTDGEWKVFSFPAAAVEKPWDSQALPNLGQIVRFAFFQYGSETALDEYTATVLLDELMIRNAPLNEFPLPADPRSLIDDFEGYAEDAALTAFYSYVSSPATTTTVASLETPAPQGSKALRLSVDFSAGQYPWGSVRSAKVAPFSFPTNAVASFRFRGDPSLADASDAGTAFWISFYDASGGVIHHVAAPSLVTSGEWTSVEVPLSGFGDTSTVDVGNLVQWRLLVQGWEGTAESPARSGVFLVDDVRITVPALQVSGTPPPGMSGDTLTQIVVDEAGRVITADIPAGSNQGYLTITPAVTIQSVAIENGKLTVRW